ncbi:MAG: AAA family ATPase [Minicystis sp.]
MTTPKFNFQAHEAERSNILLRAAFCGPSGSGKTKTAMLLATRMIERLGLGPLYVIDAENRSALRYAWSPKSQTGYRFKHVPMPEDDYSPQTYMAALDFCEAQGAGVILIDSLSHAWNSINGVLEQVDALKNKSRSGNAFSEGWGVMTPVQNRLIQRLNGCSVHLLFTLRAKVEWVMQENDRGKKEPVKVGLAPVQREGMDYEPDLFFDMSVPHNDLTVSKSRCERLFPGETVRRPGVDFADTIIEWISDAAPSAEARTLGEAVSIAAMEGIVAGETRSTDGYRAARAKLTAWCRQAGVSEARHDGAQLQVKERVAAAVRGAATAVDPGAAAS